ncbi:MAG: hypothetical protein R3C17_00910 [Planctomycetaceae bacterium]
MSIGKISTVCAACMVLAFFVAKLYFHDNRLCGGVFLDGRPLAQADLFFIDDNALNPATRCIARTDVAGRYESTQRLPPGVYRVVVRRLLGGSLEPASNPTEGESAMDDAQLEARVSALDLKDRRQRRAAARQTSIGSPLRQLPGIYSSPEDTVLRVRVPEYGSAEFDLHLSWGGIDRIADGNNASDAIQ